MKTEDLIDALVVDLRPCSAADLDWRLAMAAAVAGLLTVVGVVGWLQVRPDLADAVTGAIFWGKAAYTATLTGCAFWLLTRLGRPGVSIMKPLILLTVVLSIAAAAAGTEFMVASPLDRSGLLLGGSADVCPGYILALSGLAAPFVIWGARQFAAIRPGAAGTAAGVLAGSIAATAYGLHCPERTAVFVVVWYSLGIAISALAGGLLGRRLFRW